MFLNITEDDIRMNCPETAPMTLRAFNRISPRQINSNVSVLNPYEIPRFAPTSSTQFAKTLLQQTPRSSQNAIVNNLQVAPLAQEIAAKGEAGNFTSVVGNEDSGVVGLGTTQQGLPDLADKEADKVYAAGAQLIEKTVDIIANEITKEPAINDDRNRMMGGFKGGL